MFIFGRQFIEAMSARFIADVTQARQENDCYADHDNKAQYNQYHPITSHPRTYTGRLTNWQAEYQLGVEPTVPLRTWSSQKRGMQFTCSHCWRWPTRNVDAAVGRHQRCHKPSPTRDARRPRLLPKSWSIPASALPRWAE